ncbi:hypothetical protein D9619_012401 [Psilocybe cf. subviscida]|uniref:Uncharacterized protein n=1 Tax=Psilocybe cf. subviscida TaxID=2480587 RepID=A0A8H5AR17_9AGAR|nr:hypothetical protein D9619_012401 [Psilocybe cf. subviscida]
MKFSLITSILGAILAANLVYALQPCKTTADCANLGCAAGSRLCEESICSSGGFCSPPFCAARGQSCPHSPSTAPTMKLPILPSILTALLVSNATYVHAAEVACTTDADCLAVRCPNNGRRCTTTRCVVGVCETPECTPGPGQMCR